MGHAVVTWVATNAEDVALAVGTLCVSAGVGLAFGYPFGLIAFGAICIAYGVWITIGAAE